MVFNHRPHKTKRDFNRKVQCHNEDGATIVGREMDRGYIGWREGGWIYFGSVSPLPFVVAAENTNDAKPNRATIPSQSKNGQNNNHRRDGVTRHFLIFSTSNTSIIFLYFFLYIRSFR